MHGAPHMPAHELLVRIGYVAIGIIAAFMLGRILHELTHYLAAGLLGAEDISVTMSVASGRVEYTLPGGHGTWRARVINASPQLLSVLVVAPFLAWLYVSGVKPLIWPFVLGFLGGYLFIGSASDLFPKAARGNGHLMDPTEAEKLLMVSLGLTVAAVLSSQIMMIGYYRKAATVGLAIASIGVLLMGLDELQKTKS